MTLEHSIVFIAAIATPILLLVVARFLYRVLDVLRASHRELARIRQLMEEQGHLN